MLSSLSVPMRLLRRAAGGGFRSIVSAEVSGQPILALTFDDGPGPYTESILDVLERYHARATFFAVGHKVAAQGRVLRRAHDAGHAVGNHTFNHLRLPQLSLVGMWREIRNGRYAIEDAIGARVCLFRSPFGDQTPQSVLLARLLGHEVICWSADGNDWTHVPAPVIYECVQANIRPGAIVVLHDEVEGGDASAPRDRTATVGALSIILEHLGRAGIRSVAVPDLLRLGRPRRVAWFGRTAVGYEKD